MPRMHQALASTAAAGTPGLDQAIARLEAVVRFAIEQDSRLGYFAALYLEVTREVRRRVLAGEFQDGARMDRLDAAFARRYLDAFDAAQHGEPVTQSWRIAFETAPRWRPLIIQHLLLGINAHINLDLGIAAAEVAGDGPLAPLHADFVHINAVLAALTDDVQRKVARSAPAFGLLDRLAGRSDEMLANFSIEVARDGAWSFAEKLHALPASKRADCIALRDAEIAAIGHALARPGPLLASLCLPLRLLESGSPAQITRRLS
jgi:hypothetical protein